jgi:hypothetical protein
MPVCSSTKREAEKESNTEMRWTAKFSRSEQNSETILYAYALTAQASLCLKTTAKFCSNNGAHSSGVLISTMFAFRIAEGNLTFEAKRLAKDSLGMPPLKSRSHGGSLMRSGATWRELRDVNPSAVTRAIIRRSGLANSNLATAFQQLVLPKVACIPCVVLAIRMRACCEHVRRGENRFCRFVEE